MTANVCKKITAQLTGAIGKQEDVSVQLEALDILSDILSRYEDSPPSCCMWLHRAEDSSKMRWGSFGPPKWFGPAAPAHFSQHG